MPKRRPSKIQAIRHRIAFSRPRLLIFIAIFAAIGGYILFRSFASTIYYVSPTGSDSNPCSQSAPCKSLNQAYQVASPGDTVQIAGGSYGDQTIAYRANMQNLSPGCDPLGEWGTANTTNCISFVPATGANVTTGKIEIHGSGIFLDGTASAGLPGPSRTYNIKVAGYLDFEADTAAQAGDHVTATGVDANNIGVFDINHLAFKNVDSGGHYDSTNCGQIDPDTNASVNSFESKIEARQGVIPTNIVLDGIYFHDTNRTLAGGDSDCHDGGLFFVNGDTVAIRNSVFSQNWVYNIQVQNFNSYPLPTNVTIENNWFGCGPEDFDSSYGTNSPNVCNGQAALQFDNTPTNWLVRYNSTGSGTSLYGCYAGPCTYNGLKIIGNVGERTGSCDGSGVTYAYNAWAEGPCGPTDVTWNGSFVSTAVGAENFHLSNGTNNAVGLVTPTTADYALATDIDGNSRSVPRDAGADKYGTSTTPPNPTITLTASPSAITAGNASTLTWSSANATSCTASGGWSGSKATSGSQSVSPTTTSTYSLSCSGTSGNSTSGSATVTVNITPTPPPPPPAPPPPPPPAQPAPTVTFKASPTTITSGSSSTLTWSSTNATACTASGAWNGSQATSGTKSVSPTATSTYSLSCSGAGGSASTSANVTVNPPAGDTAPPTVSITAPNNGVTVSAAFTVSASASDNVAVSKVDFYADGNLISTATASPYVSLHWDSTTVPNGNHTLMARATDSSGNQASSSITVKVANGDTTAPTPPSGLTAAATGPSQVNLSWTASTDNVGVTGYYVVRGGTTIAQTTSASYSDTSVGPASSYSYQVMAYDAAGNTSSPSNTATAKTPSAPDTSAPTTPANLVAAVVSTSQVNLSWNASTDNVGVAGYNVYRNGNKIASITTTSFGDTGLSAGTTYSYYVTAYDTAGNLSQASTTARATTMSPPPPTVTKGNLSGRVTTIFGAPIAAAIVSVNYGSSYSSYSTDANGNYYVGNLPAGSYSVTFSKIGYLSQVSTAAINSGQTTSLNVTLKSFGRWF